MKPTVLFIVSIMTAFLSISLVTASAIHTNMFSLVTTAIDFAIDANTAAECHPRCDYTLDLCVRGFEHSREQCARILCAQAVVGNILTHWEFEAK